MDKLPNREEARKFLEGLDPKYTLDRFETFVENYNGPFKNYLPEVVKCIKKMNETGPRVFDLGESEIESILDKTIPEESS